MPRDALATVMGLLKASLRGDHAHMRDTLTDFDLTAESMGNLGEMDMSVLKRAA